MGSEKLRGDLKTVVANSVIVMCCVGSDRGEIEVSLAWRYTSVTCQHIPSLRHVSALQQELDFLFHECMHVAMALELNNDKYHAKQMHRHGVARLPANYGMSQRLGFGPLAQEAAHKVCHHGLADTKGIPHGLTLLMQATQAT